MADASVRLARATDAEAIAAVQVRAWRDQYAGILPAAMLADLDVDAMAATWREAVVAPPTPAHRVAVAMAGPLVVGLLAWGPATDPDLDPVRDVEVLSLLVDPAVRSAGHGSRLLAAWADMSRDAGATGGCTWLPATDDLTREFLTSAGWGPDGAHRELALEGADPGGEDEPRLTQVRLVTSLT